jgi:hypothetical protein
MTAFQQAMRGFCRAAALLGTACFTAYLIGDHSHEMACTTSVVMGLLSFLIAFTASLGWRD